jgi:hypothetical protein
LVRDEVKDIVAGSSREQNITTKDLEDVKAAQKLIDLQAEASKLATKGSQMQFLAFGEVKAGVVDAICLLKSHDTLKAIKILEEIEQVSKLRLDVVRRAGSSPGQRRPSMRRRGLRKRQMPRTISFGMHHAWKQRQTGTKQEAQLARNVVQKAPSGPPGRSTASNRGVNHGPFEVCLH